MTTTLQRLLKYPHAAVFDKRPGAELAFRIQHPAGASWRVSDGLMVALADGNEHAYALSDLTINGLCAALASDGFEVLDVSSSLGGLSAHVLIDADGGQSQSNGDQVLGFTSLLWSILSVYAGETSEAATQVREALRQMVLTQAEGIWLDLWGSLYAVGRLIGEADAQYAERIPEEAFRVRVNKYGIERAILDATGYDVRIAEPWREIFTLNESLLSGPDKLYDGVNAGYHLIRPETSDFVDWSAVHAVIDRNRAAGVMVLQSRTMRGFDVDGTGADATLKIVRNSRSDVINEDRALLDYMMIEDLSILNHAARRLRIKLNAPSHVVVDFGDFDVAFKHNRTFRTYFIRTFYEGQYWLPHVTWANADEDWSADAFIASAHTRS